MNKASLRRFVGLAAAGLLAIGGVVAVETPAHAVDNFATAAIADNAETHADLTWGGQCKAFAGNVVKALTGAYPPGYQQGFANAGAVEITDPAQAIRGDIIQITPAGSNDSTAESMYDPSRSDKKLHTTILRGPRKGDGTFDVIDSNWGNNQLVLRHTFNPYSWASGSIIKIWRFGTGGPGGSYVGKIVQWVNGGGQPNTSWLVKQDGRRYWIPSTAIFYCNVYIGYVDAGAQSSAVLDSLPDAHINANCPVQSPTYQDQLRVNQGLWQNATIRSTDGRFVLVLQSDHNFVLYGPNGALWATNRFTGGYVLLQGDCNLVGYNMWNQAQWSSGTAGLGGGCLLVVQNDGNLVIYSGSRAVWDRYRGRLV